MRYNIVNTAFYFWTVYIMLLTETVYEAHWISILNNATQPIANRVRHSNDTRPVVTLYAVVAATGFIIIN